MSARVSWGGCGWNKLLQEAWDQKFRLGWLRLRTAWRQREHSKGGAGAQQLGTGPRRPYSFEGKAGTYEI